MREALLAEEFEKLQTTKGKGAQQADVGQSDRSASGTRRTRSQAAPEWSEQDTLILVNEIAAVEGECADALSTYQKWTIIAENCTALDVARTSYQCRRKWDSLLEEYKLIAEWEMKRDAVSYWSLDRGRRQKVGLPLDFTEDLFRAIDEVVKTQEECAGTDPDTDPEAEFDAFNSKETGSKKSQRASSHRSGIAGKRNNKSMENEMSRQSAPNKTITKERTYMESDSQDRLARCKGIMEHASPETESEPEHQRTPQKAFVEETKCIVMENESQENESQDCSASFELPTQKGPATLDNEFQNFSAPDMDNSEENEHISVGNNSCYQLASSKSVTEEKELVLVHSESQYQATSYEQASEATEHLQAEKEHNSAMTDAEKRKQMLVEKLQENAQLVHAIIAGKASQDVDDASVDKKHEVAFEMNTARKKADELIACIADLAKNLDFLNDAVQECQGRGVN